MTNCKRCGHDVSFHKPGYPVMDRISGIASYNYSRKVWACEYPHCDCGDFQDQDGFHTKREN